MHSAILLTCINYLVLKTNLWSFGEWPFYTGFYCNEIFLLKMENEISIGESTNVCKSTLAVRLNFFTTFYYSHDRMFSSA